MKNPFDHESKYRIPHIKLTERLEEWIESAGEESSVCCGIYGLAGTGKSGFLKSFFSPEKCALLAEKGQLYPMLIAAESPEPERMLEDMQKAIAAYAAKYVPAEKLPAFPAATEPLYAQPADRLRETVRRLREHGYHVSIVLDEFHRISKSNVLRGDHYDTFRNLKETQDIRMQYIVATDSDFDPHNKNHSNTFTTSFFVHIFDHYFTTAKGMTREEFDAYIDGFSEEGAPSVFTKEELTRIYELSGGIPDFAWKTARTLFALKAGAGKEEELERFSLEQCRRQMESWCVTLSPGQKALLYKAARDGVESFYEGDEGDAFDILTKRGFFVEENGADAYGFIGKRKFVCTLFKQYAEKQFVEAYNTVYSAEGQNSLSEEQAEVLEAVRRLRKEAEDKIASYGKAPKFVQFTMRQTERIYAKLIEMEQKLSGDKVGIEEVRSMEIECEKLAGKL